MASKYPWLPWAILIVVVIAGGGVAAYAVDEVWAPHPGAGRLTVEAGDNVTVQYIGRLSTGPEAGKIFDTSFWSIASNNLAYPKTLEFSNRGQSNYTQLSVYVGPNAPSSGFTIGNRTFIGVVSGFWKGLIGTTGNVSRTVTFAASEGYGPADPSCYQNVQLSPTIPALNVFSVSGFSSRYPGVTPATGLRFNDSVYGWPDYIVAANSTQVTVLYQPTVGEVVQPYGWNVAVTGVATTNGVTTISLFNELTASQSGLVLGKLPSGVSQVCSSSSFIVSNIDTTQGNMTWNFNSQTTGVPLTFTITPVDIFAGPNHVD